MGNFQKIITLITLINLGGVFSQKVTIISEPTDLIVQAGQRVQLECHYKIDTSLVSSNFAFVPNFYKFQDFEYIEDRKGQEIDVTGGVAVILTHSVQQKFIDDVTADFEDWTDSGSTFDDGERRLILTIQSAKPEDSGAYICEAEQDGEVFQRVHTLTVVPNNVALDVHLSGMEDIRDNTTWFEENKHMVYYSKDRSTNPKGLIQCKACDGAAKPVVKVTIGEKDITNDLQMVEETDDITLTGDIEGKQQIKRCVTHRNDAYLAEGEYDGEQIVCRASVSDSEGNELSFEEVERTVVVYHGGRRIEAECPDKQYSQLGDRGQISCSFTVNPDPSSVIWEDRNDPSVQYNSNDEYGDDWSTTLTREGSTSTATLFFDAVEARHYTDYNLIIGNDKAGDTTIVISFEEGEATGSNVGGASGLHCTLSLVLASVLFVFKLLTL